MESIPSVFLVGTWRRPNDTPLNPLLNYLSSIERSFVKEQAMVKRPQPSQTVISQKQVKRYWFISYACRYESEGLRGKGGGWSFDNDVIDIHPALWLKKQNQEEAKDRRSHYSTFEWAVIWAVEISEQEAVQYK